MNEIHYLRYVRLCYQFGLNPRNFKEFLKMKQEEQPKPTAESSGTA